MSRYGWKVARLIDYMDASFADTVREAVEAYVPYLDESLTNNPFGVSNTNGMWGGSTSTYRMWSAPSTLTE